MSMDASKTGNRVIIGITAPIALSTVWAVGPAYSLWAAKYGIAGLSPEEIEARVDILIKEEANKDNKQDLNM